MGEKKKYIVENQISIVEDSIQLPQIFVFDK